MKQLFRSLPRYLVAWLIFGALAAVLTTPVITSTPPYWTVKGLQALGGIFGIVCALVFTVAQNRLNPDRKRGRTWEIVLVVWIALRVALAWFNGSFD